MTGPEMFPPEHVKSVLLEFTCRCPEPCFGDFAGWAVWYEAQRAALLVAAERYDPSSLEYGELFVPAHHAAKQAVQMRAKHDQVLAECGRVVCRHGHLHSDPVRRSAARSGGDRARSA